MPTGIILLALVILRCWRAVVCGVVVSAGASGRIGAPGNGRTARPLAVRLIVVAPQWACGDIAVVRWAQPARSAERCQLDVAWPQVNLQLHLFSCHLF